MRAFKGGAALLLALLIGTLHALDESASASDSSVAATAQSTTTAASGTSQKRNDKVVTPKNLEKITRGISRLEVTLERLNNRVERLIEMDRLKKIIHKMDKKSQTKSVKARRGASVAAAAGRGGASVAASASRRAAGGTGAASGKKRKPANKPQTTPRPVKRKPLKKPAHTVKPSKKRAPKKKPKSTLPVVDFHKTKRGGTSVAVSAGSASAGAAAGGK